MRETFVELGIIIKSVRFGECDARLAVFTATGVKWYGIKGVYRPKARFANAVGILTVAEFTIAGSSITGINVLVSPYSIAADINRFYLGCSIADALMHLEFVEQAPRALVTGINALTDLATTEKSCYPIFIDFYGALLEILGYAIKLDYDPEKLTHEKGKKLVKQICDAFLQNADYKIQFCDMMY